MMLAQCIILTAMVFVVNAETQRPEEVMVSLFETFISQYQRSYASDAERNERYENFKLFMADVDERNRLQVETGGEPCHGITKFADWTVDARKGLTTYSKGYNAPAKSAPTQTIPAKVIQAAALVDWYGTRTTPIRDQGQCGSCWAFSAIEQIESDAIRLLGWSTGTAGWLSTQQTVSCDTKPSKYGTDGGCNGGNTEGAYTYLIGSGVETEVSYPYAANNGACTYNSAKAVIGVTAFYGISGGESAMLSWVQGTGPLSVCLDASSWNSYTGNTYTHTSGTFQASNGIVTSCTKTLDHCVQITGVNTGASIPYWILRNQWGAWGATNAAGVKGFIYLKYGVNMCAIATDPTYTIPYYKSIPGTTSTPTKIPIATPTSAPVTTVPIAQPTSTPVSKPVTSIPTNAPVISPTSSPVTTPPTNAPVKTTSCSAGYYSSAGSCVPCAVGSYSNAPNSASSCTVCPTGTRNYVTGSTSCTTCSAGAAKCQACPSGGACAASPDSSCSASYPNYCSSLCYKCSSNYPFWNCAQRNCWSIGAGYYYTGSSSSTSYAACPAGTYNPTANAGYCITCPAGTTSVAGSSQCVASGSKSYLAPSTTPGGIAGPSGASEAAVATTTPSLRH